MELGCPNTCSKYDRYTLLLIQEEKLSVSRERMCTILVNRIGPLGFAGTREP